jgi:hypothetical protein
MAEAIPTIKHIPKGARAEWSQLFVTTLNNFVDHPSRSSLLHLLMLPKCILGSFKRGGKRAKRAGPFIILHRIQRWHANQIVSLWEEAHRVHPLKLPPPPKNLHRKQLPHLNFSPFLS